MKIEIKTDSYNERRYSKPWIANVSLVDDRFSYSFGSWIGDSGYAGLLVLDCTGKVFARGQKDTRGNNTENYLYKVNDDGTFQEITKVEAYQILKVKESEK